MTNPIETITALRHTLHAIPECAMKETKTKETLIAFLREHTTCTIHDRGAWFYARRDCGDKNAVTIAFRADMDAILRADTGEAFHGCGHDGHAACVAGLALLTEDMPLSKNLIFLFQPGEETGEGAKLCRDVIAAEHITTVYGCHTIPGYPAGEVLWRREVFACASCGMLLSFHGQQCHAAYPETGRNPAKAVFRLLDRLDALTDPRNYRGMVLATVCGVRIGAKAFGVSAGDGALYLTVRAHYEEELHALTSEIERTAHRFAQNDGITLDISYVDVFPDTVNDAASADAFYALMQAHRIPIRELAEPMRWSEDFGHYCKEGQGRGVFFGIGAGEDSPALHTDTFCYNDALIARTEEIFSAICQS